MDISIRVLQALLSLDEIARRFTRKRLRSILRISKSEDRSQQNRVLLPTALSHPVRLLLDSIYRVPFMKNSRIRRIHITVHAIDLHRLALPHISDVTNRRVWQGIVFPRPSGRFERSNRMDHCLRFRLRTTEQQYGFQQSSESHTDYKNDYLLF